MSFISPADAISVWTSGQGWDEKLSHHGKGGHFSRPETFKHDAVGSFPNGWIDAALVDPANPAPKPSAEVVRTTDAFGHPTKALATLPAIADSQGIYRPIEFLRLLFAARRRPGRSVQRLRSDSRPRGLRLPAWNRNRSRFSDAGRLRATSGDDRPRPCSHDSGSRQFGNWNLADSRGNHERVGGHRPSCTNGFQLNGSDLTVMASAAA